MEENLKKKLTPVIKKFYFQIIYNLLYLFFFFQTNSPSTKVESIDTDSTRSKK